jgi:hypothetical protein
MAGTISIPIDEYYYKVKDWLIEFFNTIDKYEQIAVAGIAVGFILLVLGIVLI